MADVLDTVAYGHSSSEDMSDALAALSWDYLINRSDSIDYQGLLAGADRATDTGIVQFDFGGRGFLPAMDFSYMTSSLSFAQFAAAVIGLGPIHGDSADHGDAVTEGVSDVGPTGLAVDDLLLFLVDSGQLSGVGGEHRSPYVNGNSFVSLDLNGDGAVDFVTPATDLFWPS